MLIGLCVLNTAGQVAASQQTTDGVVAETRQVGQSTPAETQTPTEPSDGVLPLNRAWEYQHYRVRVWLATDGSPEINGLVPRLTREIASFAELTDGSSWEVLVNETPNPWNWRFDRALETAAQIKGFELHPQLQFDDKLMVVSLQRAKSGIRCRVREFDLPAQQWGALLEREVMSTENLGHDLFDMILTAFMPVAQIDNANEKNEVEMRAKAVLSCQRVRMNETGEWVAETNTGSPVFIRSSDVFLPVLRRTDRDNKLVSLEPVDFTFVTIDSIDGARVNGHVQSTVRAPLAARKSKRLQKIALVIRPPEGNTTLKLTSADADKMPMEGIEVYSRRPNASKEEDSELLGKTDWRGIATIPPSPEGMRMIYLKRGNRALKKIPIVPGFIKFQETTVTNDEARLFAEGVIEGVKIELLDLVTQRAVYEEDITKALDKNDMDRARDVLEKYKELPRPQQFRSRLTDEKSRLLTRAKDDREIDFITNMFNTLTTILSEKVGDSNESKILRKIQESAGIVSAQSDSSKAALEAEAEADQESEPK